MPLPELTRHLVEKKLGDYCERKIPVAYRHEVRLGFGVRGDRVTLFEDRASIKDPEEWIRQRIAQLRFDGSSRTWGLYYTDRRGRWHGYEGYGEVRNFDRLIAEIDRDPVSVFWGLSRGGG